MSTRLTIRDPEALRLGVGICNEFLSHHSDIKAQFDRKEISYSQVYKAAMIEMYSQIPQATEFTILDENKSLES